MIWELFTRRALIAGAGASLILRPTTGPAAIGTFQGPLGRRASIRDFGAHGDGQLDDTLAFQKAATALSDGRIQTLHIEQGSYHLDGPFDVNHAPGPILIQGDGATKTAVQLSEQAGQNAFIIRNSDHGTIVRGFCIKSLAPPTSFQHTLVLANISNVLVERMSLCDAQGYGLGIFEDVLSQPEIILGCNNIVVRNNYIKNASQYGIQHFPKVFSENALFYENHLVNCGCNTQQWSVPGSLIPSAMKVGQKTAHTSVYRNTIDGASDAVAIDIGNWEDIEVYHNVVTNCARQFVAISVGNHPALSVPAQHQRCVVRENVFTHREASGLRKEPVLTVASDSDTPVGPIEISRNHVTGDTLGTPGSFVIRPGGVLRNLRLIGNIWEEVPAEPTIIMLLSDSFGGTIIEPLIQGNEVINRKEHQKILRGIQLEGVNGAKIVLNKFSGMGENVFDLRNCTGKVVIKGNEINGFNLDAVRGAAVVAIHGDDDAIYEITDNLVRGNRHSGALVGGLSRNSRLVLSNNSFDGGPAQ